MDNQDLIAMTARRLAVCGLVLISLACFAQGASQRSTENTKSSAVRAQQIYLQTEAAFVLDHDHTKATKGFRAATQTDPRYAPAWFNLGVLGEQDKNWTEAVVDFRRYLTLQPKGRDAARAREQLQLLSKYLNGSVTQEVNQSMKYDAAIQTARAFMAHGYFRESIAEAGRAQSLDSSRWEAYAVVALCMARQSKSQEAEKFRSLAIDHAPSDKREQVSAALSNNGVAVQQ